MVFGISSPRGMRPVVVVLALMVAQLGSGMAAGQQTDLSDDVRGANYVYPRPNRKARASNSTPKYRRKGDRLAQPDASTARIGLTFWRANPASAAEPLATRDIVQAEGETKSFALVRLGSEPELSVGEQFRIGIEALRSGYLYVINRSLKTDGSVGAPYLIFPTQRIRDGNHTIRGGRMVMIPTPPDEAPFETRDPVGNLAGEEIIVLVSPKPLDIDVRADRYALDPKRVDEWVRQWGAPAEVFELVDGAGAKYTAVEKAAAVNPQRLLTTGDPMPQIVQRVAAKPGEPIVARFFLRVRQESAKR